MRKFLALFKLNSETDHFDHASIPGMRFGN